jgi:hypothetical protein
MRRREYQTSILTQIWSSHDDFHSSVVDFAFTCCAFFPSLVLFFIKSKSCQNRILQNRELIPSFLTFVATTQIGDETQFTGSN